MYDDILIPTDGSEEMAAVVDHGLSIAEAFDATVHTLYVVDYRAYSTIPEDARDRVRDALESDGHAATRAVAERAIDAGIDAVREVRWGNPPAAVLAYAAENEVDLVVMGTHGRTGYERYLLGSVAEKVVRAATVPVLVVSVGDEGEPTVLEPSAAAAPAQVPDPEPESDADAGTD
ncbi:MAG: universal stress protein [Haloferacaceae archaeon]